MSHSLRTPLEQALGTRLDLDFSDLDLGDLDLLETQDEAREVELLEAALETGDFLFRVAVRSGVPGMGVR